MMNPLVTAFNLIAWSVDMLGDIVCQIVFYKYQDYVLFLCVGSGKYRLLIGQTYIGTDF